MPKTLLVVSAHSADFVWRAAGAIATIVADGGTAHVLALSYGERGESGELWKWPGQTEERVKEIRHGEALTAATALISTRSTSATIHSSSRRGRSNG